MPNAKPAQLPPVIQLQSTSDSSDSGGTSTFNTDQLSLWTLFGEKPAAVQEEVIGDQESILGDNVDLRSQRNQASVSAVGCDGLKRC